MSVKIPREQMEAIFRHAETTYPNECCGLLLGQAAVAGDSRHVAEAYPMRNANQVSPRNRFDFDPPEHLRAQREARERGLEVVGFYHSHPDHPARPSQYDLDHAAWPGYSYLIVSILGGRRAEGGEGARSWDLAPDRSRFLAESLTIVEASHSTGGA